MQTPKIIIMAAGAAKRWNGDKPKHLTEFDGEPLLYRTIRLIHETSTHFDTHITISQELLKHIDLMKLREVEMYLPKNNVQEIDRFLSCRELWGKETLFLYGDVYYTPEAIKTVLSQYAPPATFYGRRRANAVKRYGEMFALRADTSNPLFEMRLQEIRAQEIAGRARGLGWDVWRAYGKKNFVELDPRLEDFDKIEEVKIFKKVYSIK